MSILVEGLGFAGGSDCVCLQCGRLGFDPWVGKIPWSRKWQPTPVFLLQNAMDRGDWCAIVHGVTKSQIQLSEHIQRQIVTGIAI